MVCIHGWMLQGYRHLMYMSRAISDLDRVGYGIRKALET